MNHIIIIGRLTADPDIRNTQSGLSVTSFTVAVDRDYTPKGGEKQTDFIDCVAWRERGEAIAKYFTKGRPIILQGSIQTRMWEDKQGQKRKAVELVVDRFEFVPSDNKRPDQTSQGYTNNYQPQQSDAFADDDDTSLPFDF